jgi:hypothetical protein
MWETSDTGYWGAALPSFRFDIGSLLRTALALCRTTGRLVHEASGPLNSGQMRSLCHAMNFMLCGFRKAILLQCKNMPK